MKIDHFWQILKTEFSYQSPRRYRLLVENFHRWATFIYYIRLFNTVFMESLIARKKSYEGKTWAKGSLNVLKVAESAGGKFHVSGLKGLSCHSGPFVFVANHMSLLDTLVLPCILLAFGRVTFVVKEGLLKYPVLGTVVRAIHPIAVTRENPRKDLRTVMKNGQDIIRNGCSIIIFPQATRSAVFQEAAFNSLGVKLAKRAGVPVIPVALKTDFQGNGRFIKDLGAVDPDKDLHIKFGEPMVVKDNEPVIQKQVVKFIVENLTLWGAKVHMNVS